MPSLGSLIVIFRLLCLALTLNSGHFLEAPKWEWEPKSLVETSEETIFELDCPATGSPPPLIQWSFNGVPFHELVEDSRRILLNGGRILRIRDSNHDLDSGLYQCNGSNYFGHISTGIFVKVKAFAPRFAMSSQRIWRVIRNSVVDLNCDVEAAPPPRVHWVDANDTRIVLVSGKTELFPNHTLRIYDVTTANDGYYYCNVSNKYGINRAMNKIETYSPTYWAQVPDPAQLTVDAFELVELRCQAIADPRLSVDYIWTRNGKPITDVPFNLTSDGVSVLRLVEIRGRASGRIECAAVTDVDVKLAGMELLVRDIPEPPEMLKVDCTSGQFALVLWRRPDEHGSQITHFSIDMTTGFQKLHEKKWRTIHEERNLNGRDLLKAAIPLSPWVNYTFRMFAHNAYGSSEPSTEPNGTTCSTPPDVPFSNPVGVRAFGTEPDNLCVLWVPMDKHAWNAPALRYLVRYRLWPEGKNNTNKWLEFFVEDSYANETVIREQPTFQRYQIQVRAVNAMGHSAVPPPTVVGYSGEDVPMEAPANLRFIAHLNHSAVRVGWDPVAAASVRGHFRGYKVNYWLNERPFNVGTVLVGNGTLRTEISGLEALRNYTVKVHVVNGQYESVPSNFLEFGTREGAPSKVHNLRVHAVGSRSVFLTWEPPIHPNGKIRGYYLNFENSTSGFVEETYVLHRQLYYLHEFLEPNLLYKVSVWGETNGGEGPRVTRPIRTWLMRDPDPPLFTIRHKSPSAIRVQWFPGNGSHWRVSGTTFYIKYSKEGTGEWSLSEAVSLPDTILWVDDLVEDTNYILVGVAKEGSTGRHIEAAPLFFRTESTPFISPVNKERLRNAAWFIAVLVASSLTVLLVALMCWLANRHTSGLYAVRLREKRFGHSFRYENVYGGAGVQDVAAGNVVANKFLDDGDEHKKFVERQFRAMISRSKKKAAMAQKPEAQKSELNA